MKNGEDRGSKIEDGDPRRFRIKHPSFGYLLSFKRTEFDGAKYHEEFTHDPEKAPHFSRAQLRESKDANGNGLMSLMVQGYTGLTLEEAIT